jgi:hypothetical protein
MCECRKKLDEKLAAKNAKIATGFTASFEDGPTRGMQLAPPMIVLEKADKKKRGSLPILMASYCPFCGHEYAV